MTLRLKTLHHLQYHYIIEYVFLSFGDLMQAPRELTGSAVGAKSTIYEVTYA